MKITRATLDAAVAKGLLSGQQSQALWDFLAELDQETPSFKPAHILYYLGGMIAIGAMSFLMTLARESFRGGGVLLLASAYALLAIALTEFCMSRKQMRIPAGIMAALAITMVPLAVYGAQHLLGLWPDDGYSSYRDYHEFINWRWAFMEIATLMAGALALWRYRLPFLVMPIAVTLWYMSMDIVPLLLGGQSSEFFSDDGKLISTSFGALMLTVALWVDLRTDRTRDFAFWLYLFGVLAFWGGLTSMHSGDQLGAFIYALINLFMIAMGAALARRVFAVFGGIGLAFYLGQLSYHVFRDSLLFPIVLTLIGFAIIGAGVAWQKREAAINAWFARLLPMALRRSVQTS